MVFLSSKNSRLPKEILGNSQFIPAVKEGLLRFRSEVSLAEYSLTLLELKTWFIVIASLKEQERPLYVISAMSIADQLGINKSKARGTIVSDIFRKLMKQTITLTEKNETGEANVYEANFLGETYYDANSKIIAFSIPPILHQFLFHLKNNLTLSLDISDILKFESVMTIRMFVYLRELDRLNIHSIPIEEFRKHVNFSPSSDYRVYKQRVIKPAEKEIRDTGMYRYFHIEDDGRKGIKATTIYFGFTNEEDDCLLLAGVAPKIRKELLKKFSRRVLLLMDFAIKEGFNPAYIKNQFDIFDDEHIAANFQVVFDRIISDKQTNRQKTPDEYGRYFMRAVIDNWAGDDITARAKQAKQKVRNAELQKQMQDITEQERFQSQANYIRGCAKEFIEAMSLGELVTFIKENKKEIQTLAARGREFNMDHALSRKKTYREFRILCQLVAGKMMAGQIHVPAPKLQSLF